jgi:alkanesulfonate monooxygenase SsuD/methylene tetrahydromethanopterin reductase-like flavin-dependent oxidoreductase (luciferase family)
VTGKPIDPAVRLRELIDLAKIADQAGLDVFGVGEHHRPDFAIASPPVVLAAVAEATARIRLTSTVTVLSTADPVKVFEDFTALDLVSGGRAEVTAGRGAYTESAVPRRASCAPGATGWLCTWPSSASQSASPPSPSCTASRPPTPGTHPTPCKSG